MGSKIQMILIRTNIKNMLRAVMAMNDKCVDDKFSKPFKSNLAHHTKIQKLLIFQFKKQGTNLLDVSI